MGPIYRAQLMLCILVDFPIHTDTKCMELPILYFKGSQVEVFKLGCFSVHEDCFYLSKQCRPRWKQYYKINIFPDPSKTVLLLWIHFCYLCFLSVMLACLLIAAMRSPAGKGLPSWFSCMWCFLVFLSLSNVVSWVWCGAWLYQFLIFAFFLTFTVCQSTL